MKKYIILLVIIAAQNLNSWGQAATGRISFLNSSNTRVSLFNFILGDLGYMPPTAGEFKFQLFIAPVGTANPLSFTPTSIIGTNQASPGRFTGGVNIEVPGVLAGETRSILIRGWSTGLGDDYSEALAAYNMTGMGYIGQSSIGPSVIFGGFDGNGTIPTSPIYGGLGGITSGFYLTGVPEPTVTTLIGLSSAALFFARKSKRSEPV